MRKLKHVDVEFISLVSKGANKKLIIYKSAQAPSATGARFDHTFQIRKTDEEKRLVYGIVYTPEEEDSQGDFMEATDIEKMAHAFLKKMQLANVDKGHNEQAGEGVVVESWIVRKGDALFPDEEGAWAVAIKVANDETWEQVKKGEITGLSMAGPAIVEDVEKAGIVKTVLDAVRKKFSKGPVKKDFNDELMREKFFPMMDAMYAAFWSILNDETIVDKVGAVAESLQQFKDQFTAKKSADEPDKHSTEGDIDMKPEEVTALVNAEITKVVKPLTDSIAALQKAVEDGTKATNDRLEKVEKSSTGRQSIPGTDTIPEDGIEVNERGQLEPLVL